MSRQTTRRRYLALGAAFGFATLAGCADGGPGDEQGEEGAPGDDAPEEENASVGSDPENESESGGNETDDNESDGNESAEDEAVQNVDYQNPDGSISFVAPEDGDEVSNPVEIEAEVENFELRPAEEDDGENGVGHLHVIVDEGCVDPEYAIPFDEGYHHLSDAETQTELELEPGEHDLCLQAGDGIHNAYALTDEITIEVVEDGGNGDGNATDSEGNETATNESSEDGNESENDSDGQ